MTRGIVVLSTLTAALLLSACGGDDGGGDVAAATVTVTSDATSSSAAQADDPAGRANCIRAGLSYAPISAGLSGDTDLEAAISYFDAPELETATSEAGGRAQVALAELAVEVAQANADVVIGSEVDSAWFISTLMNQAESACVAVGAAWS